MAIEVITWSILSLFIFRQPLSILKHIPLTPENTHELKTAIIKIRALQLSAVAVAMAAIAAIIFEIDRIFAFDGWHFKSPFLATFKISGIMAFLAVTFVLWIYKRGYCCQIPRDSICTACIVCCCCINTHPNRHRQSTLIESHRSSIRSSRFRSRSGLGPGSEGAIHPRSTVTTLSTSDDPRDSRDGELSLPYTNSIESGYASGNGYIQYLNHDVNGHTLEPIDEDEDSIMNEDSLLRSQSHGLIRNTHNEITVDTASIQRDIRVTHKQ